MCGDMKIAEVGRLKDSEAENTRAKRLLTDPLNRPEFKLPQKLDELQGDIMAKYETAFKLKVIKSNLAGEGRAKLLARRWAVPEEKNRAWVSHFRLHSTNGLRPKRGSCSVSFEKSA